MRSLAKPRKITIIGDDQRTYMFLGKPKDDLRKDARLMDFNALINKLLKANSDSRRRQLRELCVTWSKNGVAHSVQTFERTAW
jgi:serine/threonine-protein kinase ATR